MRYYPLSPKSTTFEADLEALRTAFNAALPENILSVTWGALEGETVALVKAPGPGGFDCVPEGFVPVGTIRPLADVCPGTPLKRVYGLVTGDVLREVLITSSHVIIGCAVWTVAEWRDLFASGGVLAQYGADAQAWGEEHLESVLTLAESLQ